jgi:Domain of unknown function (DUF4397)
MKTTILLLALLIPVLALTSCSDGSSSGPQALLTVIHASGDAPEVDVLADGQAVVSSLRFGEAAAGLSVPVGSPEIAVQALTPGGPATVIGPVNLTFAEGRSYTVIALGDVAGIGSLVLERGLGEVMSDSVRVEVVHGAAGAPPVEVYVTAPGADLATSTALGSFSFGNTLGPAVVPAGDYQIRVTTVGSLVPVFDSGTVSLAGGSDLSIVAIDKSDAGASPIDLLVVSDNGFNRLQDVNTQAALRVIHGSPDAPNVDVIINDDFANPAVSNLPFGEATAFATVPIAPFNVKVVVTGTTGPAVIDTTVDLEPGDEISVAALRNVAEIEAFVYAEDQRGIATEARLRLIHGSPTAGPVDIYVTAPFADLTNLEPNFAGVLIGQDTGYVPLAAGSYDVTVTAAGSKVPAIGPVAVNLAAGEIYTAVARDNAGGGLPLGLILLDAFTGN